MDNKTYFVSNAITAGYGTSDFTVNSGANCWLIAGNQIKLLPGVKIESGGSFKAKIYSAFSATKSAKYTSNLISGVSTDEIVDASVILYPNPTSGRIWLQADNDGEEIRISIYDLNGRCLFEKSTHEQTVEIDLSNEANGLYILKIQFSNQTYIRRIILN